MREHGEAKNKGNEETKKNSQKTRKKLGVG